MTNSSKYIFLASGAKNGEGFWFIGVNNSDENIIVNKYLLDFYRKELIGVDSAKKIIYAINLNLKNLSNELENNKYILKIPPMGISFDIPLDLLEKIFDFWLDIYKDKESWETCIGLLKIRKRVSLLNLIKSDSLKGITKKWAIEVEKLHNYVPNSIMKNLTKEPMWK